MPGARGQDPQCLLLEQVTHLPTEAGRGGRCQMMLVAPGWMYDVFLNNMESPILDPFYNGIN